MSVRWEESQPKVVLPVLISVMTGERGVVFTRKVSAIRGKQLGQSYCDKEFPWPKHLLPIHLWFQSHWQPDQESLFTCHLSAFSLLISDCGFYILLWNQEYLDNYVLTLSYTKSVEVCNPTLVSYCYWAWNRRTVDLLWGEQALTLWPTRRMTQRIVRYLLTQPWRDIDGYVSQENKAQITREIERQ